MSKQIEDLSARIKELEARQSLLRRQLDDCSNELEDKKKELDKLNRRTAMIDSLCLTVGDENMELLTESIQTFAASDRKKRDAMNLTNSIQGALMKKRKCNEGIEGEQRDSSRINRTENPVDAKKAKLSGQNSLLPTTSSVISINLMSPDPRTSAPSKEKLDYPETAQKQVTLPSRDSSAMASKSKSDDGSFSDIDFLSEPSSELEYDSDSSSIKALKRGLANAKILHANIKKDLEMLQKQKNDRANKKGDDNTNTDDDDDVNDKTDEN